MANIRMSDLKGFDARYHRNGVGGAGFFACKFRYKRREMTAVVFDLDGHYAVMSGSIDERWRGDDFEGAMRESIAALGDRAFGHSDA